MRVKWPVIALAFLSAGALAQQDSSPRKGMEVESRKDEIGRTLLRGLLERQLGSRSRLQVDYADETALGITVTDGSGRQLALDFEPNETSNVWRPVFGESDEPGVFGRPLELWAMSVAAQKQGTKGSLEPFSEDTARIPHDDVTVFVVTKELVLIFLWEQGQVIGTFYAVDTDAAIERQRLEQAEGGDTGGVTATPKQTVCEILYRCCTGKCDTYWIFACIGFVAFCV